MHRSKVAVIVAILAAALLVGVAVGQTPYTFVQALKPGQTVYVSCDGASRLRADRPAWLDSLVLGFAPGE